jgi:hypothetical protein
MIMRTRRLCEKQDWITIVDNVVDFAVFPVVFGCQKRNDLAEREKTHSTVASTIFLGKSSAPTSPATPMASPPAALISSTTAASRFSSILCQTLS